MVRPLVRRTAATLASTLAIAFGIGTSLPAAHAAERTATLVGSLQNELGCSDDWQPTCDATALTLQPGSTTYSKTFQMPAGTYE